MASFQTMIGVPEEEDSGSVGGVHQDLLVAGPATDSQMMTVMTLAAADVVVELGEMIEAEMIEVIG